MLHVIYHIYLSILIKGKFLNADSQYMRWFPLSNFTVSFLIVLFDYSPTPRVTQFSVKVCVAVYGSHAA